MLRSSSRRSDQTRTIQERDALRFYKQLCCHDDTFLFEDDFKVYEHFTSQECKCSAQTTPCWTCQCTCPLCLDPSAYALNRLRTDALYFLKYDNSKWYTCYLCDQLPVADFGKLTRIKAFNHEMKGAVQIQITLKDLACPGCYARAMKNGICGGCYGHIAEDEGKTLKYCAGRKDFLDLNSRHNHDEFSHCDFEEESSVRERDE